MFLFYCEGGKEMRADKEQGEVTAKKSDEGNWTRSVTNIREGFSVRSAPFTIQEVNSPVTSGPHLAPSLYFAGFCSDHGVSRRRDIRTEQKLKANLC